jgi:hypothetical protein
VSTTELALRKLEPRVIMSDVRLTLLIIPDFMPAQEKGDLKLVSNQLVERQRALGFADPVFVPWSQSSLSNQNRASFASTLGRS